MRQRVVSPDAWTKARVARLAQGKELTRLRDAISRQRRGLPWIRIDKEYSFEGWGPWQRRLAAGQIR
jgi:predicted dithiol-disulfide oxidoreductase (DUF899 family)